MSTVDTIRSLICSESLGQPKQDLTQAAVLIGIIQTASGDRVIFNRRAPRMNKHASEICLPGGVLESVDQESHVNGALREANEEIGLPEGNVQVIGVLESCITSQQIEVTPVVALVQRPPEWILQPNEVVEVMELPLGVFLEAENYKTVSRQYRGRQVNSVAITCNYFEIWGLTAKIMMRLQQLTRQRETN